MDANLYGPGNAVRLPPQVLLKSLSKETTPTTMAFDYTQVTGPLADALVAALEGNATAIQARIATLEGGGVADVEAFLLRLVPTNGLLAKIAAPEITAAIKSAATSLVNTYGATFIYGLALTEAKNIAKELGG